jgi:hypothetical protein
MNKEQQFVFEQGFKDGFDERERRNASDEFGPNNSYYHMGYNEGIERAESVYNILSLTN